MPAMLVENALAVVVWAPVAVNTYRLCAFLASAARYARLAFRMFVPATAEPTPTPAA